MLPTQKYDLSTSPFIHANGLSDFPELLAAQSTRYGGVSSPPYESLNLGLFTPDAVQSIHQNRKIFFDALNWPIQQIAESHQVHGNKIKVVDKPEILKGFDGLITNVPGIALTITVADCCPILAYDPVRKCIGAVHAGWKGTTLKIAALLIDTMERQFSCQPKDIHAWIGVCIRQKNYEVDQDVAQHFSSAHKIWDTSKKKYFIDIRKANASFLLEKGVSNKKIHQTPWGTFSHPKNFFSHRHSQGNTGRGLAVIGMRPT